MASLRSGLGEFVEPAAVRLARSLVEAGVLAEIAVVFDQREAGKSETFTPAEHRCRRQDPMRVEHQALDPHGSGEIQPTTGLEHARQITQKLHVSPWVDWIAISAEAKVF